MTTAPTAPLEVLAAARDSVELGPVGYAAVTTDACRAYRSLAGDPAALRVLEPQLLALVRTGSPAAVIYAALLLKALGRDDLPALLAPYDDDRRPCTIWPGGCGGETHWLSEATRWVMGQYWTHPERMLADQFALLATPNWLELPSPEVMERAPTRRRDCKAAQGRWTFDFAELWVSPELGRARAHAERALAKAKSPAAALYAAMLLRRIDRDAGERALVELADEPGRVEVMMRGRWRNAREAMTMADAVARCRTWIGEQDARPT